MREKRIDIENTFHHIVSRGVNKFPVFLKEEEKLKFRNLLLKTLKKYEISILSYVIMNNHFHLFIKREKSKMSDFIHSLLTAYSKWYNNVNNRTGHLFERRYFNAIVDNDNYFNNVLVYIHNNPLRTKDKISLENYKWSSYKDFLNFDNTIININLVMDILNENSKTFKKNFIDLHKTHENIILHNKKIRNYNILGSKSFIENLMETINSKNKKRGRVRKNIQEKDIWNYITNEYNFTKTQILGCKKYSLKKIENEVCYLFNKYLHWNYLEIAEKLGLNKDTVSKKIKKFMLNGNDKIRKTEEYFSK